MSRQSSRHLRIGYLGTFYPQTGGAAVSATQLMGEFAAAGHMVSVLAPMAQGAEDHGSADSRPRISIRRFPVPFFHIEPHLPIPPEYARWEREGVERELPLLIEQVRPDVLLIREIYAWYAMEIARRHGVPAVILVRGNPTAAIVSGLYPSDLAERLIAQFRKADLVVTVADYYLEPLRRLGVDQAVSIPNAVDTDLFSPRPKNRALAQELEIAEGDVVVVLAGHLKPLKRPLDVVRSAALALKQDPRLLYLVVGDGPSLENTRKVAQELAVDHRVRFVGRVGQPRMPDYLNLADVVVMASELEGLSRVYLETMACGRTLLASDIAPARELIQPGVNGFTFPLGNVAELARATLRVAADPELRRKIGKSARERACRHHIRDACAVYEKTLVDLLDRRLAT